MTDRALENVEDVYPLSPLQQGMVFHTIAEPATGVFVNQINTALTGDLDVALFRRCWDEVVARHAILRTAFVWDGVDEPLQVVRQSAELTWTEHDWSGVDRAQQDERLAELLREDRFRGFDLARAPLIRMALIKMGADAWQWVWSMHHLVADGWSTQVLLDEVFARYRTGLSGEHIALGDPFAYREFIATLAASNRSGEEQFWRDRLAGFTHPHRLDVPGLPPDGGQAGHRSLTLDLDAETTARLRKMAGAESVTLNTAVVAAWSLLLSRWTRQQDVVFGVTMAGRDTTVPGVDRAVGLFINTLPLRLTVPPGARLGDWLRDIQKSQLEIRDVEHSSLASVQRWSDAPHGEALFESVFVFENYPPSGERDAGDRLTIGDMEYLEQSNYPLAVLVVPGERLSVTLVYDSARLHSRAVAGVGDQLMHLLRGFAASPGERLASFPLVSPAEEEHLRSLDAGPELGSDERSVVEIIEAIARARPDAPAVAMEGRALTYGELVRDAEVVARRLVGAGVAPNRPVGLYLSRSFEMVVGILAILKAGGAYVPLDPAYPPAHIAGLLEGDAIDIVLTAASRLGDVPDAITTVVIDSDQSAPDAVLVPPSGDDLAYVIHTSGSTGRPKGVMVTHRNLAASTRAREAHYGAPVGRFLLLSSFAFDSSVAGIFWTLCSGGTIVLPAPGLEQDVDALLSLARREEITHLLGLPALYRVLLEHAAGGELASLQVAIVAGEACPPGMYEAHAARVPAAELHNEYGPTEATVWCTVHRAGPEDAGLPLPIGRPIAGTGIHLLDEAGNRVPTGFAGELCVAGAGVTPGYLHRPDLTAERFVTLDLDGFPERLYRTGDLACYRPDGTLLFLGRADRQLKIRGHRIETGAVEAALRAHPLVREAAVAGRAGTGRGAAQLVGYVVAANGAPTSGIRADLGETLPDYLVPDVVVPVADLPRLPNGKVAYDRLPDPGSLGAGPEFVGARNETEATLAAIWADLLDLDRVGVGDDFFALGGDSIVSIQMISRARQAGVWIEPGQIAAHPTVAALAAASAAAAPEAPDAGPVAGLVPLGPIQHWFFESNLAVPQHWNQSSLFEVPADIESELLGRAIQACVDHHDMLRARFERRVDGWQQHVDESRRVELEIIDLPGSGNDASSLAHHVHDVQAGLDLEGGRLLRAVLLRASDGSRPLLLLAIHHLVIDAVSWAVLTEDLETAYEQARSGQEIALPPRTTSYRDWVGYLAGMDLADERRIWVEGPARSGAASGVDPGTEGEGSVLRTELDEEATRLLLTTVHEAYQTRAEDLLVAALGSALGGRGDSGTVRIGLEGHGRPTGLAGIDLSRTIGWFSAYYPLNLSIPSGEGELIKTVKEQLRAVPHGGIGYGVLRYLNHDDDLVAQESPDILFNYLSRTRSAGASGGLLTLVSAVEESSRDPRNVRSHAIDVVARIESNRLVVDWYYAEGGSGAASVRHLAGEFMKSLHRLIDHCLSEGAGGFTPSDFPEADLDQDELDAFLEGL